MGNACVSKEHRSTAKHWSAGTTLNMLSNSCTTSNMLSQANTNTHHETFCFHGAQSKLQQVGQHVPPHTTGLSRRRYGVVRHTLNMHVSVIPRAQVLLVRSTPHSPIGVAPICCPQLGQHALQPAPAVIGVPMPWHAHQGHADLARSEPVRSCNALINA